MTAAPRVPNMHASGTFRFGFSTAAEFCAADSMPRNAHRVSAMLEPIPAPMLSPFGFHAAANVSELNQNQPKSESRPTGMMTPHTVIEPIRADLRHVRRQHDDPRAHHVHGDDERQLDEVHLLRFHCAS